MWINTVVWNVLIIDISLAFQQMKFSWRKNRMSHYLNTYSKVNKLFFSWIWYVIRGCGTFRVFTFFSLNFIITKCMATTDNALLSKTTSFSVDKNMHILFLIRNTFFTKFGLCKFLNFMFRVFLLSPDLIIFNNNLIDNYVVISLSSLAGSKSRHDS